MSSSLETRVRGVAGGLSVAERARLVLAAWCEDEAPDESLLPSLRYGDAVAHQRLVERVVSANEYAAGQLSYWQLFVCELEVYLLWLESHRQWEAHAGPLAPGTGAPSRWDTGAGLTMLYGTRNRERRDDAPPALDRLAEALEGHIVFDLGRRWRELGALEQVFAELAGEYGCATMHHEVREAVGELRAKLLDIRDRLGTVPAPVLSEPEQADVDAVRARILPDDGRT